MKCNEVIKKENNIEFDYRKVVGENMRYSTCSSNKKFIKIFYILKLYNLKNKFKVFSFNL